MGLLAIDLSRPDPDPVPAGFVRQQSSGCLIPVPSVLARTCHSCPTTVQRELLIEMPTRTTGAGALAVEPPVVLTLTAACTPGCVGRLLRLPCSAYETGGAVFGLRRVIPSSALVLRPCSQLPAGMLQPDSPSAASSNDSKKQPCKFAALLTRLICLTAQHSGSTRPSRERHRPLRDSLPWDALQGYDVSAAQPTDPTESKEEIRPLFRKRKRKALTTEAQRERNREYHQRYHELLVSLNGCLSARARQGAERIRAQTRSRQRK